MKLATTKPLDPLWIPSMWDNLFNLEPWEALCSQLTAPDPDTQALRLLTSLASRDKQLVQHNLDQLQGLRGALVRGARMMALVDLERFAELFGMRDEVAPTGSSLAELFDSANANFAVGMAAGALGRAEQSFAHLHAALMLARSLGMTYREQHISVELEAVRTSLGDASPARIRQVMAMLPMTARRTHRSSVALAEAYMALGDYTAAASAAPASSDLRAFVEVLIGRSGPLPRADAGEYAPMALALSGQIVPFAGANTEPEAGYENMVKGFLLTRSAATAGQAATLLAAHRPKGADQRFFWAVLMWSALTEGASAGLHSSVVLTELHAALAALTRVEDVGNILQRLDPRMFVALAYMPGAHPCFASRVMEVPLLTGNHLTYQGNSIKLPGKTGSNLVAAAAEGRERKTHPQERARFQNELTKLELGQEPVNLGWVARALASMAHGLSRREKERWVGAMANMTQCLSGHEAQQACSKLLPA